ncbi:MAG: DUF3667 domain-containing protein [Reichenbachiella sp.]|uniref:DUF3667 domain-containing protein n=1 Tax=Reichenbachiella sp. TaxID=2184521 RepID=UPI003265D5E0
MAHLFGDLINNLLFVDNRFWVSLKYLFFKPGLMTVEFLEGKRRKFMPPVTIFLFVNVFYFFTSPMTDYSLPLVDQLYQPTHKAIANRLVEKKLAEEELTMEEYAIEYNQASDNVSKTIMILNIPIIAFFVYLLAIRKRKFYYDSLIFSIHYFTIFLSCVILSGVLIPLYIWFIRLIGSNLSAWTFWFPFFMFVLPVIYAMFSFYRFIDTKWYHAIWSGLLVFLAGGVAQFIYRSIVFFVTFWTT